MSTKRKTVATWQQFNPKLATSVSILFLPGAPVTNNNNNNNDPPAPTAISNENFSFVADKVGNTAGDVTEERLQSPVESHFALTPVGGGSDSSSPGNGFSGGHVCTDLLQEELDQLENSMKLQTATQPIRIDASFSVETLATPSEEHINMFSRSVRESQQEHKTKTCGEEGVNKGEVFVGETLSTRKN